MSIVSDSWQCICVSFLQFLFCFFYCTLWLRFVHVRVRVCVYGLLPDSNKDWLIDWMGGGSSDKCSGEVGIWTEPVSPVVFEISVLRHIGGHDLDLSRSCDVICHRIIRFAICHLLLVVHFNRACISKLFRDIGPQMLCKSISCTKRHAHARHHVTCIPPV